jgi:hypothetical protein
VSAALLLVVLLLLLESEDAAAAKAHLRPPLLVESCVFGQTTHNRN